MKTVLIVEPEPLMQRGLSATVDADPDLRVVAQVTTAEEALVVLRNEPADVVLTEFILGQMNGLDLTSTIRQKYPRARVLTITGQEEAICAERALRYGAHGLVVRHDTPETIIAAIHEVIGGNIYVSQQVLNDLLNSIAHAVHPLIPSPTDVLSDREMQLFEMMGQGLDLRAIALAMGVTEKTAASYRTRAKEKLNLCSTLELMRRAAQWSSPERVCYSWPGCPDRLFAGDPPVRKGLRPVLETN